MISLKTCIITLAFIVLSFEGKSLVGEDMNSKFKVSSLFPKEVKSRLEIIQHPVKRLPGGCLSTGRSPNGAYMWVKEIEQGVRVVVVYVEGGDSGLQKIDEFTFNETDIPILSRPVDVDVAGENIIYFSGGNPTEPRRILFERTRIQGH